MVFNKRVSWGGEELEMSGWGRKREVPSRYTVEDAVYSATSNGGIESNIDQIRKLIAAVLSNMPEDKALAAINSVSDDVFVLAASDNG